MLDQPGPTEEEVEATRRAAAQARMDEGESHMLAERAKWEEQAMAEITAGALPAPLSFLVVVAAVHDAVCRDLAGTVPAPASSARAAHSGVKQRWEQTLSAEEKEILKMVAAVALAGVSLTPQPQVAEETEAARARHLETRDRRKRLMMERRQKVEQQLGRKFFRIGLAPPTD